MLTIGGGVFVRENNVIVGWISFIEDSRGIAADAAHEIVSRGGDGGGVVAPREEGTRKAGLKRMQFPFLSYGETFWRFGCF